MPMSTVLTPFYGEKVSCLKLFHLFEYAEPSSSDLSLREIIREKDQSTRVTLLEYLKQLHPIE